MPENKEETLPSNNPLYGKKWTRKMTHKTYESAVADKKSLESPELSVKIMRTAENNFVIKTRSTSAPVAQETKGTKNTAKTRAQRKKEKALKHKAREEKN